MRLAVYPDAIAVAGPLRPFRTLQGVDLGANAAARLALPCVDGWPARGQFRGLHGRRRAVSFFAPDETGHEVRCALDMCAESKANALAGILGSVSKADPPTKRIETDGPPCPDNAGRDG